MISENVQTDTAVAVDVGVVDAGGEVDLGRLEGVVCGEVDGEEEDTARVWGVTLEACQLCCCCVCCASGDNGVSSPLLPNPGIKDLRDP